MNVSRGRREAQRRRTRKAIIAAAVELIGRGDGQPSMAEIARAADVSRRTVYLYFPTLEQLLADAALEGTRSMVEPQVESSGDAPERLEALVRATQQGFAETEHLGRTIIRATVTAPQPPAPGTPRRGYRRVEWIERALEPLRETLPPERFERLVSALALLIGWESMIVLQDIRGLTQAEAEEVCVWAARALLDAA
ncbi:MAG TPA: helix-turn-helix domain-containing protein [Gaiellaceae bacterium]